MSTTNKEELHSRYGNEFIESDSDEDELLGSREDDDVLMTSSKHVDDHTSPPSVHMHVMDYQCEHELDYDEVIDVDQGRLNKAERKAVVCSCL